jgi:hypothetical protein
VPNEPPHGKQKGQPVEKAAPSPGGGQYPGSQGARQNLQPSNVPAGGAERGQAKPASGGKKKGEASPSATPQ